MQRYDIFCEGPDRRIPVTTREVVELRTYAMPLVTLQTEADYEKALSEIASYFDNVPKPGTQEAVRFEKLTILITAYEAKHHTA
jgi:hypothetical protein